MRVTNNLTPNRNNIKQKENYLLKKQDYPQINDLNTLPYLAVYFGSIANIKPKKINIELEKSKLIRQLDETLKANAPEKSRLEQIFGLFKEMMAIKNDENLEPSIALKKALDIQKKLIMLKKGKSIEPPAKKQRDERLDCGLLNEFKSALLENNFNLAKVFENYYGDLKHITSVEKLKELFPNIKVPKNPADVVAKKIEGSLTRDFYEEFDELMTVDNPDINKIFNFANNKLKNILKTCANQLNVNEDFLYEKLYRQTHDTIVERYKKLYEGESFAAIPEFRKQQKNLISDNDLKLLSVDYDDYVLNILRKHYFDGKKFNEIEYKNCTKPISPASFNEPEYKFEKISEKVKNFINSANILKNAQRDYQNFNVQQFKNRLTYYANTELGNNEEIFERIIAFDASNFGNGDIQSLVKFLKELDLVSDGVKSLNNALKTISSEDFRPKETERLTEIERQKAAKHYKKEMKKAAELNLLKRRFDDAVNFFYMNDLSSLANILAKYRPQNLSETSIKNVDNFISSIAKLMKQSKDGTLNKSKLESQIIRWDMYNSYKNTKETSPVFKKALEYAKDVNGEINIDKAGKYILNAELVDSYPESIELAKNPEVFVKIMERTLNNKNASIEYLCKFDDYMDLSDKDKTFVSKFADLFDLKDSVDKNIFKHIIENDYLNSDSTVITNFYEKGNASATIGAKAKQQIIDKYKYPQCVDFFINFEEALSSFASNKGSSGIKKIGRNNEASEFRLELKIKNSNDRLFSSKNNYYFDIFSDKGLH